jgi:hypothetical protein
MNRLTPLLVLGRLRDAQAYGVKCDVGHTQVPALNTHGRYVHRTGWPRWTHTYSGAPTPYGSARTRGTTAKIPKNRIRRSATKPFTR